MKPNQGRRKPFQGKKLHKDLRDFKNQEIKRSLVHRARLRKNYFKLIEKEGGKPEDHEPSQEQEPTQDQSQSESEEEEEDDKEQPTSQIKRSGPLPPQQKPPRERPQKEHKRPMNFAERARIAKERKEQKREEQLRRVQEKRQKIEQSNRERESKKLSLSKRTKSGQPVMGPKITDLLEKLQRNN